MDIVEGPYLLTCSPLTYRPSGQDIHFEDSGGADGFELPGAAPSADSAPILHCSDARWSRYGGESRHREQDRTGVLQGGPRGRRATTASNRRTKFVVLAVESSSGWTDPTVQKLVNVWEQQHASRHLGPDRRWSPAGSSTRHELCPARSNTGTRFPSSCGPFGVQVPVPG
jgi:hypothetical protein